MTADSQGGATPLFVLAGGVRRIEQRIRISARLTEGPTGRQVWAERFDAPADEILAVQDDIVARVAAALALKSDEARLAVARRKPLTSLEAYDCWLRGRSALQTGTVEGDREARTFFERALELDPHFARAYAGLSLSHFNEWSCQAWIQWDETERLAYHFARRAADLDTSDAMVEIVLGRITLYRGHFDEAAQHIDRAIALNPNEADVLAHAAACRALLGDGASGLELATKATRLNPASADWYIAPTALSLFVLGRYEESIAFGLRMPHATLDCPALLAAALALAGDRGRAAVYLQRFLADFEERVTFGRAPEAGEPLRWLLHVDPFRRTEDVERITTGLRLAGLPMDPDSERVAIDRHARTGPASALPPSSGLRTTAGTSCSTTPPSRWQTPKACATSRIYWRPRAKSAIASSLPGGRLKREVTPRSWMTGPGVSTAPDSWSCSESSTRRNATATSPGPAARARRWTRSSRPFPARWASVDALAPWVAARSAPGPR